MGLAKSLFLEVMVENPHHKSNAKMQGLEEGEERVCEDVLEQALFELRFLRTQRFPDRQFFLVETRYLVRYRAQMRKQR
jgi:hypothetical protein